MSLGALSRAKRHVTPAQEALEATANRQEMSMASGRGSGSAATSAVDMAASSPALVTALLHQLRRNGQGVPIEVLTQNISAFLRNGLPLLTLLQAGNLPSFFSLCDCAEKHVSLNDNVSRITNGGATAAAAHGAAHTGSPHTGRLGSVVEESEDEDDEDHGGFVDLHQNFENSVHRILNEAGGQLPLTTLRSLIPRRSRPSGGHLDFEDELVGVDGVEYNPFEGIVSITSDNNDNDDEDEIGTVYEDEDEDDESPLPIGDDLRDAVESHGGMLSLSILGTMFPPPMREGLYGIVGVPLGNLVGTTRGLRIVDRDGALFAVSATTELENFHEALLNTVVNAGGRMRVSELGSAFPPSTRVGEGHRFTDMVAQVRGLSIVNGWVVNYSD